MCPSGSTVRDAPFQHVTVDGLRPGAFKAAYITPLLKKPGLDVGAVENYRPVSNLSDLSKLLERVVCNQVESHLAAAGLFPRHQSAYRKGHSTETALVKVCADLIEQMDSGHHHVLLALLDLSAPLIRSTTAF